MRFLRSVGVCLLFLGGLAGGQETRAWSENGAFAVGEESGRLSLRDVRLNVTAWSVPYPQDAPPRNVLVTGDGRRVVLQDYMRSGRHGESGGNKLSLVILGEGGRVVAAYKLSALLTSSELISTGYWETHGLMLPANRVWIEEDRRLTLYCSTWNPLGGNLGLGLSFDLQSGKELPVTILQLEAMRKRSADLNRQRLRTESGIDRDWAILEAERLKDREALPLLLELTKSDSHRGQAIDAGCSIDPLQGRLLVQQYYEKPDDRTSDHWVGRATTVGYRLDDAVIQHMVATGRAEAALAHLQALDKPAAAQLARTLWISGDAGLRAECLRVLRYWGNSSDAPLFRSALDDEKLGTDAFYGLCQARPVNLREILLAIAQDPKSEHRWGATTKLATMGDPQALQRVVQMVRRLGSEAETGVGMTMSECCEILADQKPAGAREALQGALDARDPYFDPSVCVRGALVLLGERQYLPYLREAALKPNKDESGRSRSDDLRQAQAIEWLVRAQDRESLGELDRLSQLSRPAIVRGYAAAAAKAIRSGWTVTQFWEALAKV